MAVAALEVDQPLQPDRGTRAYEVQGSDVVVCVPSCRTVPARGVCNDQRLVVVQNYLVG